MTTKLEALHIMPGLFCNFTCSHCVNDSGPKRKEIISEEEIQKLSKEIETTSPNRLIFTGGEPTLHIEVINKLIAAHPEIEKTEVFITTNGWFSKNETSIANILDQFKKLSHLQLSYDIYHGTKISTSNILLLKDQANRRNIKFNVSVCISSPKELLAANSLQKSLGGLVIFQKVDASGRAKSNNLHFKYPLFEHEVLNRKCPNLGQISYIVNKGFSVCCSNLAFNQGTVPNVFHDSIEKHLQSEFYLNLKNKTFGEVLKGKSISTENLQPEFSSPCRLCELAHKKN